MKSAKVTSSHVFSTLKLHFPMAFQWLKRAEKRARKPLIQRVQPGPTGLSRIIPGSLPPSGFGSPISSPPGWGPRAPGPGIAYSMVPRSPISLC